MMIDQHIREQRLAEIQLWRTAVKHRGQHLDDEETMVGCRLFLDGDYVCTVPWDVPIHDALRRVQLELSGQCVWMIAMQLHLALRHPEHNGIDAEKAREQIRDIANIVCVTPSGLSASLSWPTRSSQRSEGRSLIDKRMRKQLIADMEAATTTATLLSPLVTKP
jgi:hypothetical protein